MDSPVETLCAYHASYPGTSSMHLVSEGATERNRRDEPLWHTVTCGDPWLTLRIAARYPGVASHAAFLQGPLWYPRETGHENGPELIGELRAAAAWCADEPAGERMRRSRKDGHR